MSRQGRPPPLSRLGPAADKVQCSNEVLPVVELQCSCKQEKISSLFSCFNKQKATLVERIGFGGLLKLKDIGNLNLDLCLWLFQIADFKNMCLHIPGGVDLPFSYPDVHLVLRIPFEGATISFNDNYSRQALVDFSKKLFRGSTCSSLTISSLEEILTREYGSHMSQHEVEVFSIATVLYASSYLLAPGDKNLFPVQLIENFITEVNPLYMNWAELVIDTLHEASRCARFRFFRGKKKITLFGCCLFLQVFYLDNLNFGPCSPCHDSLPRASHYKDGFMDQLVLSDSIGYSDAKLMLFGKNEVRRAFDVIYTRGWKQHYDRFDELLPLTGYGYMNALDFITHGINLLGKYSLQSSNLNIRTESELEEAIKVESRCYQIYKSQLNDTMEKLSTSVAGFIKTRNLILYRQYIRPDVPSQDYIARGAQPIRRTNHTSVSKLHREIEVRRHDKVEKLMAYGLTMEEALSYISKSSKII